MPHLTQEAAITHTLHNAVFTEFANTATGARELAAWRTTFAPNSAGAAHRISREEILHVLTGELSVQVGDEQFTACAGDAILVPAGTRLSVGNATDHEAQAWVVTSIGMTAEMSGTGQQITPPWAQ